MRTLATLLVSLLLTLTLLVGCGGGDEKQQSSEEATTEATTEETTSQAAQQTEQKDKQKAEKKDVQKDVQKEQVSGQEDVSAAADRALEKQDTSNIPPLPPEEADARRECLLALAETVPPEQLQRATNVIIAMANERGVTPEELVGC